ncbi:MAG: RNA 2'-phosphotransferase, partial [bacterium]|nr:RNA 2'-phosphotransferase [bacterium]
MMRRLRLTEADLLAIVLHSEKSRFQVAALIQEGRPVRLWTIRATNGHSIEWLDRNRLSWDIPRELVSEVPCCVHLSEWCSSLSISVQGLLPGGGPKGRSRHKSIRSVHFSPFDVADPRYCRGEWESQATAAGSPPAAVGGPSRCVAWYCNLGDLKAAGLDPRLTANAVIDVARPIPPRLLLRAVWLRPAGNHVVLWDARVAKSGQPELVANGTPRPRLHFATYQLTDFSATDYHDNNMPHFTCPTCHNNITNGFFTCPLCGAHFTYDNYNQATCPLTPAPHLPSTTSPTPPPRHALHPPTTAPQTAPLDPFRDMTSKQLTAAELRVVEAEAEARAAREAEARAAEEAERLRRVEEEMRQAAARAEAEAAEEAKRRRLRDAEVRAAIAHHTANTTPQQRIPHITLPSPATPPTHHSPTFKVQHDQCPRALPPNLNMQQYATQRRPRATYSPPRSSRQPSAPQHTPHGSPTRPQGRKRLVGASVPRSSIPLPHRREWDADVSARRRFPSAGSRRGLAKCVAGSTRAGRGSSKRIAPTESPDTARDEPNDGKRIRPWPRPPVPRRRAASPPLRAPPPPPQAGAAARAHRRRGGG